MHLPNYFLADLPPDATPEGAVRTWLERMEESEDDPSAGREAYALLGPTARADQYQIPVIPKGTTHEYWKSIDAGAVKAQRELAAKGVAVNIIWKGPLREDDRDQQIQSQQHQPAVVGELAFVRDRLVLASFARAVRDLPHCRDGRDEPPAVRPR